MFFKQFFPQFLLVFQKKNPTLWINTQKHRSLFLVLCF